MSLVIARRYENQIFIISDTKLTDAYGEKIRPTQGIIKSIIINSNLCLSFAGITEYADEALKSFRHVDIGPDPFNRTVKHFFDWHARSREKTDFILAFGEPRHTIVEIKDGQSVETDNSWIGDVEAFARFQGYFHNVLAPVPPPLTTAMFYMVRLPEPNCESTSYLSRMLNAMIAINSDTNIECVGDFAVPVAYDKDSFQYMDYGYVLTNPVRWDVMAKWFSIPFGTTAEGGYGFNFVGGLDRNRPIAAMYFLQGNLGILFTSQDEGLLKPMIIRDVGPIEFQERVKADFNLEVGCIFAGADTYGSRGRRRFEASDYEGALADYNKSIEMDAKDPRSFRGRAMVHGAVGEMQEAIEDWTKAIELEPDNAQTYRNRGLTHGQMGNLDQAISDCSIAINITPGYALAYRTRAIAFNQKGDIDSANKDLERFRTLTLTAEQE